MDRYSELCVRIVEHCERRQWYGPDGGWESHRGYFDAEGKLQVRAIAHDPHTGFEFPPATEAQLRATEEALGISLPPMLRPLYTLLATVAFRPPSSIPE